MNAHDVGRHSSRTRSRPATVRLLGAGCALLVLTFLPFEAAAQEAACLMRGTSLADSVMNPPDGGDNDFFSNPGGPPNLLFIIDTSGSMRHMPIYPSSGGCSDATFNALTYDPTVTYDDFDPSDSPLQGWDGLYDKGKIYVCDTSGGGGDCTESNAGDSISNVCGGNAECLSCLDSSTRKGYWMDSANDKYYADGNFMNIFPPKYVVARKVMKEVVVDTKSVRMGVLGFNGSDGAKWITNSGMNPPCNLAWPPDRSNFASNRTSIVNKIENITASDFSNRTPLAEALHDAGQFYNFGDDFYDDEGWTTDSNFTSPNNAGNNNQWSVCWECQSSNIVIITDGMPSSDNDDIDSDISNLVVPCPSIGGGSCGSNLLHKVAAMLHDNDVNLQLDGVQNVTTYTVAFALNTPDADTLLSATAEAGGGFYAKGDNAEQLAAAIKSVIDDVISRSVSFTTSSFAGVQSAGSQSVLVPRLIPDKGRPWKGELYRFDFLSEFVTGIDFDGDDKLSQSFLVDDDCAVDWTVLTAAPSSCKPVGADPILGLFWKLEGGTDCPNPGWCTDSTTSNTPATYFWEAGEELVTLGATNRRIYTVIDNALAQDGKIDANDPVILFEEAQSLYLLPYFSVTPAECDTIASKHGVTFADMDACAKGIIRFVRGRKMDDSGDNPYLLSDIFHSNPVVVEPPTPFMALNSPIRHDQSMITLGDDRVFESDPSGVSAYGTFATTHRARDRVAVVGSNGGMIHAFHVGECILYCGLTDTDPVEYDRGSGEELWAFIPPDLLAKLKYFVLSSKHHFFVDGAPWVRNIWVDGLVGDVVGAMDYKKQSGEFRTIAIINERRGGVHRTALDVTDLDDPSYVPKFLWTFPHVDTAGTSLEVAMELVNAGESWGDILPAPPPIGPIRYLDAANMSPGEYNNTKFTERWIALFGAGYDPANIRGRGWYMVDAYTGETLWSFNYEEGSSVEGNLHYSFAAVPAMTAWGDSVRKTYDNRYFDTMFLGDTGGQLWTGRFADPDPSTWAGARLFVENKSNSHFFWRNPFFSIVRVIPLVESGYLRVAIGTGNRHHLRDPGGGECSFDNLPACNRMGCKVKIDPDSPEIGPYNRNHLDWVINADGSVGKDHWRDLQLSSNTACSDGVYHRANIDLEDCPADSGGTIDFSTDALFDCSNSSCTVTPRDTELAGLECVDQSSFPKNRFYSIRVFGDNLTPFNDAVGADAYDTARLTNGTAISDILDAADVAYSVGSEAAGWYYEYNVLEERTASGATDGAGCVIWASLQAAPAPVCSGGGNSSFDCTGSSVNIAYMYFRDVISGKAGCTALSGPISDTTEGRVSMGSDPKPPPPPQFILQIGKGGAVKGSITTAEGGGIDLGKGDNLFQSFSAIDATGDLHDIRHAAQAP